MPARALIVVLVASLAVLVAGTAEAAQKPKPVSYCDTLIASAVYNDAKGDVEGVDDLQLLLFQMRGCALKISYIVVQDSGAKTPDDFRVTVDTKPGGDPATGGDAQIVIGQTAAQLLVWNGSGYAAAAKLQASGSGSAGQVVLGASTKLLGFTNGYAPRLLATVRRGDETDQYPNSGTMQTLLITPTGAAVAPLPSGSTSTPGTTGTKPRGPDRKAPKVKVRASRGTVDVLPVRVRVTDPDSTTVRLQGIFRGPGGKPLLQIAYPPMTIVSANLNPLRVLAPQFLSTIRGKRRIRVCLRAVDAAGHTGRWSCAKIWISKRR